MTNSWSIGQSRPAFFGGTEFVPPGDPTQHLLVRIWEDLLPGIHPIGIWDTFYSLGGNYSLGIEMLERIRRDLGISVPSVILDAELTIEKIGDIMITLLPTFKLSKIRDGNQGDKPLFFLHGDFNSGGFYTQGLARSLRTNKAVYIVQPHGLNGEEIPDSVEQMALDYYETITSIQPDGPYFIGGHCNGGLIAFELARLLESAKQRIGLIFMIHTMYNGELDGIRANAIPLQRPDSIDHVKTARVIRAWRFRQYLLPLKTYRPGSYSGKISLLWPDEERFNGGDPRLKWLKVARDVEFRFVRGKHLTCITTHVDELGTTLTHCLESAESEGSTCISSTASNGYVAKRG